jgi:hypothetical protein
VLAGELHRQPDDAAAALLRYQARLQTVVARKQKQAERLVASFVPRTALGVRMRDYATLLMRLPWFPRLLMGALLPRRDGLARLRHLRSGEKAPDAPTAGPVSARMCATPHSRVAAVAAGSSRR